MKTRITELIKTRYPIIQSGIQCVGTAELASAISNAGGLGILSALTQASPDALAAEIQRCRGMTDQPFGVNLTILPNANANANANIVPYADYVQAIIEGGIKLVETAGNHPKEFIDLLKRNEVKILHTCTSVRHALSAERNGVDAISIGGFECAGHTGEDDVGGLVLIASAARVLRIPVVASGGIADGRGMAAALALGAEGITMGTRFCATLEAPIHPAIKQALVNATSNTVIAIEHRLGGCVSADLQSVVAKARGQVALHSGEIDSGLIWASQAVGLINDIPSCTELMERIVAECRSQLRIASHLAA